MTCSACKTQAAPTRLVVVAAALLVSGVAVALPWDIDMADAQSIKGYEREMAPLPEGVVSQPNPLTPRSFSPNLNRIQVMLEPSLLPNPVKKSPEVLEQGQKMFGTYCTPCHGDGHKTLGPVSEAGRFPGVINIAGDGGIVGTRPDGYVYLTIRNGGAIMPYYGWAMTDDEMWSIVHYLRTLPNGQYKPKKTENP